MVDYALAAIFQECGHEVSFANIELPQGASDEDIALWAHDRAAFMLSCDRDMRGIINKQSRGQNPYYLVSRINFVQVDEGRQPDRLRAALPVIEYLRKLTAYSARNGHLIPRELAARSAVKWPPIPGFWPRVPG